MECSEEVKQAGLELVVVLLCEEEARTLARWRGQVMWHIRSLCVAIPVRYFGGLRQIDRLSEFKRVFVPLTTEEAREARKRRRAIGWDSRDWVPRFAEESTLARWEDGSD
eukprot:SAG11_NODE_4417_length_1904_cov_23.385042_1_plen_110_part_00